MTIFHQKPLLGQQINWSHPLARGLVACWLMNEGSGNRIYDLSGNKNDGIFVGDTKWVSGETGQALKFDRAYDSVSINRDLGVYTNISISAWIKYDNEADFKTIVGSYSSSTPPIWFVIALNDIKLYRGNYSESYSLHSNIWYHVVGIVEGIDATKDAEIYVNGVKVVDTDNIAGDMGADKGNFRIGQLEQAHFFGGIIDEVRIWNRALSSIEVAYLYREPYAMFEQALIWPMAVAGGLSIPRPLSRPLSGPLGGI